MASREFEKVNEIDQPVEPELPQITNRGFADPLADRSVGVADSGTREGTTGTTVPAVGSVGDVAPASASAAAASLASAVRDESWRPFLDRLEIECRRVLATADSEAEMLRANAEDEERHLLIDAHRERSMLLQRASAKQALMYQEAQAEIERRLVELDEERERLLRDARDAADRMLRAVATATQERANARLQTATQKALQINEAAPLEAERIHWTAAELAAAAPPAVASVTPFQGADGQTHVEAASEPEPEASSTSVPPSPTAHNSNEELLAPEDLSTEPLRTAASDASAEPRVAAPADETPPSPFAAPSRGEDHLVGGDDVQIKWSRFIEPALVALGILAGVLLVVWLWGP